MRIAFVVHTFFPNWRAGTEVYTRSLARKAIENGHEAFIVCFEPPEHGTWFQGIRAVDTHCDGLPVHRVSFCKQHRYYLKDYFHREVESHLIRYFSLIRPDVVHVVHAMHLSTASIWAAKKLGLPVVATATDFWYICPTYQLVKWDETLCPGPAPLSCLACMTPDGESSWIRRVAARRWAPWVLSEVLTRCSILPMFRRDWRANLVWLSKRRSWMRKTLAQVDLLLAPTPNTHRLITVSGLKPPEMRVSGFGLEGQLSPAMPPPRSRPVLRLGYIGTFRQSKGLHVLLEAMGRLPADTVELQVFGSPGHFPEYDEYIRALARNLRNVSFCGTFPNERLAEVFAGFDVLVIPSLWHENSPLVLLSAFALKTPVVVSNIGSLADMVEHGKNGLLFEMGNSDDLALQLRRLAEEPGEVERLRNGMPNVKTVDENVQELLHIYGQLSRKQGTDGGRGVTRPGYFPRAAKLAGTAAAYMRRLAFGVRFQHHLSLLRCNMTAAGGDVSFHFQWHAGEIDPEWVVFIHFFDNDGETQIQGDHHLFQYDQDPWGFVEYRLAIPMESRHRGKSYRVRLGVWNPEARQRLAVVRVRGLARDAQDCAVSLGSVQIAGDSDGQAQACNALPDQAIRVQIE